MAWTTSNVFTTTVNTSFITITTNTSTNDNKITLYPSRWGTGTTNGVDWTFDAVYDPMETCMWCGEEFRRSQVDAHEEECGQ